MFFQPIDGYDSDEEDLITLSSRWKLQNKNRSWARRKRSSSQLSGSDVSTAGSNSHSSSSLRQKAGSTDVLNERCINSNVRQLSLQAVDRISSNKLISPLNVSMQEGGIRRSSLYDNLPSGISLSTPSISSCSNDNTINNFDGSDLTKSSRNNRTNSDIGALSADDLSDLEEHDDVPSELMNLKNSRKYTTPTKNATTEEPSSPNRHKACRWHSFERTSKPNIPVR